MFRQPDWQVAIQSAAEFVRLRRSEDPKEYRRAAAESASIAVWVEVIEAYPDMRFWVAQNKTVPLEILHRLAGDPDSRVRGMVASKRKLDAETLGRLARDPDESVRLTVAVNRSTPADILEVMRSDPWSKIRARVTARLSG